MALAIKLAIGFVMMLAGGIAIGVLFNGVDSYRASGVDVSGLGLVSAFVFFAGLVVTILSVHKHRWLN